MRSILFIGFLLSCATSLAQQTFHPITSQYEYDIQQMLYVRGEINQYANTLPLLRADILDQLAASNSFDSLQRIAFSSPDLRNSKSKRSIEEYMYVRGREEKWQYNVKPVFGKEFGLTNGTSSMAYWGIEGHAGIGNFGMYTHVSFIEKDPFFSSPQYISRDFHGASKTETGLVGFSEVRGGVVYSKGFSTIGLIVDRIKWGYSNGQSNIFSGKAPAFPMIYLEVAPAKWLKFNYIHGWLSSGVVDSSRSYWSGSAYREVYHSKYLAANYITVTPFENFNISIGNSIVYSDIGLNPGYLIPVMFFKAVDHQQNNTNNRAGQNAQVYGELNYRIANRALVYSTVFIDEISLRQVFDKQEQRNQGSIKFGLEGYLFSDGALKVFAEYTANLPLVYEHLISTTTFATNEYGVGHFLGQNSDELLFGALFYPSAKNKVRIQASHCRTGEQFVPTGMSSTSSGLPFLEEVLGKEFRIEIGYAYYINRGLSVYLDCSYSFFEGAYRVSPDYFNSPGQINIGVQQIF